MATHSRIPGWEIPLTEKGGRLQSIVLQRVRRLFVAKSQTAKQQQQFNQTINHVSKIKIFFVFSMPPKLSSQVPFLGNYWMIHYLTEKT